MCVSVPRHLPRMYAVRVGAVVDENGDGEAVGRHNGMSDLYRSVHRPSSTAVCTHVLSQVY